MNYIYTLATLGYISHMKLLFFIFSLALHLTTVCVSTDAWGDTCTERLHRSSKGRKEWRQRRWFNQTLLSFTGKQLLITCVLWSGQRFIHFIRTSIRLNKKLVLALQQLCPCLVFLFLLFLLVLQCVGYAHGVWGMPTVCDTGDCLPHRDESSCC